MDRPRLRFPTRRSPSDPEPPDRVAVGAAGGSVETRRSPVQELLQADRRPWRRLSLIQVVLWAVGASAVMLAILLLAMTVFARLVARF